MASRQPTTSTRPTKPNDLLKSLKNNQKKPTILEQAAKDWKRQQFLERADLRQFEKEREIREKTRAKMA